MSAVVGNEKTFHNYFDIPAEIRKMVIDEMEPDDRCRFTRCSKICDKEAKSSEKFIFALELGQSFVKKFTINVTFNSITDYNDVSQYRFKRMAYGIGYSIHFAKKSENTYMVYTGTRLGDIWVEKVDSSLEPDLLTVQYFKKLLHGFHRSIRRLSIETNLELKDKLGFEVRSLSSMRELVVQGGTDILQLILKAKHPLKVFQCMGDVKNHDHLAYCKQMYQTSDTLVLPNLPLNSEQFLRLSASKLRLYIGQLTPKDVFNFIELWRNGMVRNNFSSCVWYLGQRRAANFNAPQLFRLLGVRFFNENQMRVAIKSRKDPSKSAILECFSSGGSLMFKINN